MLLLENTFVEPGKVSRKDDKLKTVHVHVTTAKPGMIRQLTILANFFLRKRLYK